MRVRPGCASVLDQHGDRVSGEHRRSVAIDNPGGSTGMGMMAGSGPSVAPLPGFGSNHEIAFQANTGHLWTTGLFGGDSALAMMAGTSPSMNLNKTVAFQDSQGLVERTGSTAMRIARRE